MRLLAMKPRKRDWKTWAAAAVSVVAVYTFNAWVVWAEGPELPGRWDGEPPAKLEKCMEPVRAWDGKQWLDVWVPHDHEWNECPTCGGDGLAVIAPARVSMYDAMTWSPEITVQCPTCEGKGGWPARRCKPGWVCHLTGKIEPEQADTVDIQVFDGNAWRIVDSTDAGHTPGPDSGCAGEGKEAEPIPIEDIDGMTFYIPVLYPGEVRPLGEVAEAADE